MIPKACKRLAEIDFPIAKVSAHSAREKSIRHGHPSTLHLWWARRPLAACRSMLMALLLPDPCDPHCPPAFKDAARRILLDFPGRPARWEWELAGKPAPGSAGAPNPAAAAVPPSKGGPQGGRNPTAAVSAPGEEHCSQSSGTQADLALRHALLHEFIADFANWDNAANPAYLKAARALVKAAHGDEAPLVVDPFAGGGSIPLEALRIGCDAFASDLNPVACLINKVLLEDIPRHGPKLAEELRRVGAEIKKQAEKELAEFYPSDPDGARPIAYLWARTVRCEQPNCGCEIPLIRSLWLCDKAARRRALRYTVVKHKGHPPRVEFEVFEPKSPSDVAGGTVARAKATCPACNRVLPPDRVRAQLRERRGGAADARLLAVVTTHPDDSGRSYRLPRATDLATTRRAEERLRRNIDQSGDKGVSLVPAEPTPRGGGSGAGRAFSQRNYGMDVFADLFTPRQLLALTTLARLLSDGAARRAGPNGRLSDDALADSVQTIAAIALSRLSDICNALCSWKPSMSQVIHLFARQAIPMVWDFAEASPLSDAAGDFATTVANLVRILDHAANDCRGGQVCQSSATAHPLPDDSASALFTDPPYYDAVPYADLSDFFYVWLRRALPASRAVNFADLVSPKSDECIVDEVKGKDRAYFERTMAQAMAEGRRLLRGDGVGAVVFAHKTTEGWEALLGGMIAGGWVITGSWPITTEMATRLRAKESAALSASIHLVCRPRDDDAGIGDWGEIIRELPRRIGDWMERLSGEGIRGADLVFACIGPALELFSKYARVETPDGEEVGLAANDKACGEPARRGFLSYVWEFAGRTALNQVLGEGTEARRHEGTKAGMPSPRPSPTGRGGMAGALEEDARLTALFLWTLQATESGRDEGTKARRHEGEDEDQEGDADDDADDATGGDAGGTKGRVGRASRPPKAGLTLIYDVARRFAQPLGIHLDAWEGRIIETSKGIVRLLPVGERAKQLFGEEGASAVARKFDAARKPSPQIMLDFMAEQQAAVPEARGRGRRGASASGRSGGGPDSDRSAAGGTPTPPGGKPGEALFGLTGETPVPPKREATTLDRVHAAMLLQSSGASNALRALLEAEVDRGPDFLRLANALSALYPRDSEEKRLLDAMLLAVPR